MSLLYGYFFKSPGTESRDRDIDLNRDTKNSITEQASKMDDATTTPVAVKNSQDISTSNRSTGTKRKSKSSSPNTSSSRNSPQTKRMAVASEDNSPSLLEYKGQVIDEMSYLELCGIMKELAQPKLKKIEMAQKLKDYVLLSSTQIQSKRDSRVSPSPVTKVPVTSPVAEKVKISIASSNKSAAPSSSQRSSRKGAASSSSTPVSSESREHTLALDSKLMAMEHVGAEPEKMAKATPPSSKMSTRKSKSSASSNSDSLEVSDMLASDKKKRAGRTPSSTVNAPRSHRKKSSERESTENISAISQIAADGARDFEQRLEDFDIPDNYEIPDIIRDFFPASLPKKRRKPRQASSPLPAPSSVDQQVLATEDMDVAVTAAASPLPPAKVHASSSLQIEVGRPVESRELVLSERDKAENVPIPSFNAAAPTSSSSSTGSGDIVEMVSSRIISALRGDVKLSDAELALCQVLLSRGANSGGLSMPLFSNVVQQVQPPNKVGFAENDSLVATTEMNKVPLLPDNFKENVPAGGGLKGWSILAHAVEAKTQSVKFAADPEESFEHEPKKKKYDVVPTPVASMKWKGRHVTVSDHNEEQEDKEPMHIDTSPDVTGHDQENIMSMSDSGYNAGHTPFAGQGNHKLFSLSGVWGGSNSTEESTSHVDRLIANHVVDHIEPINQRPPVVGNTAFPSVPTPTPVSVRWSAGSRESIESSFSKDNLNRSSSQNVPGERKRDASTAELFSVQR